MEDSGSRSALLEIIAQVRRRWRVKLALRGAAAALFAVVAALLLSASGLQALRFTAGAIVGFRLVVITVCALAIWWVLRPLRRRVTDAQVALYLEEHDSSLQTALLSAVEATHESDHGSPTHSAALVDRLLAQAIDRCRTMNEGRDIEWAATRRHATAILLVVGVAVLLVTLGPPYLRHGLSAMFLVARSAEAASPYRIDVRPGNATIPRGSDQSIAATLAGFSAHDAEVLVRKGGAKTFEHVPLVAAAAPRTFEGMLFHVDSATEYYVEADGVKSPTYLMQIVDLPAVSALELEYRFPEYTGLPPQKIESGGDVAALRGTEVALHVVSTMPTPGGRIVMSDGEPRPLTRQADGSLTGSFHIDKPGFYHIELDGPHGERVKASPQYTIDVVDDQPPTVSFTKPGRDSNASPVEEVFMEARAEDDFGVKSLQLVYSVNGGAEKTVRLFGGQKPLTEVSAGHTVYLEELGVQPGDFVSYYARATDNDATAGGKSATSDIYFVQIRPFRKDYKPAQSAAGMGGGGSEVGALSQQQRQIVAATFNAVRDRAKTRPEKFRENVVFLTLAQSKLRDQVQELVDKLNSRLGGGEASGFSKIAQALPKAVGEMKAAEQDLRAQNAKEALSPEQRALKLLQDAEQEYETQVAANRNGGGGGGGEDDALADDLADLFDLELDKLANQYETEQRGADQTASKQMNELLERLKELARRQQQEADRQRRMAQAGRGGSGGSGQRSLAEQAEEMSRRLEQLRRDAPRPELADAAKRLQEAADAMRRAAANGSSDAGAQAAAALERLKDAERQLQQTQSGHAREGVQSALKQAQDLANDEKDVQSEVQSLARSGGAPQQGRAAALGARKDAMASKVGDLEQQLQKLADDTRRDERDASRKLQEAAGGIRDSKLKDKIRYSKGVVQGRPEYAKAFEDDISANIEALQKKIGEAAGAMGQASKEAALGKALEQARNLVRGMESMDQRMTGKARQAGQEGQAGQRGQAGQAGQAGQRGQTGQAGQAGQAGKDFAGISSRPAGGASGGDARPPAGFSPEDFRQFRRELREREADTESLQRMLGQAGVSAGDLNEVIRQLRAMDTDRAYSDPRGLQELHAAALERMKKFEFDLRRRAGSDGQPPALSSSDEVPPSFRQAVEEYYRALARRPGKP